MNNNMDMRTPALQYGQLSPPPSGKPTMYAPDPHGSPMSEFSRVTSAPTMSPREAQMTLFHNGAPTASPLPMVQSPYSVPTPRHTEIEDEDKAEFEAMFLEHKRQKQLRKLQEQQQRPQPIIRPGPPPQEYYESQQQQPHQPPPNYFPHTPLPPHFARAAYSDSGYGSMDDPGAQFRPNYAPRAQPQQPHVFATRPGHSFGFITATGDAKVLMGDVEDDMRPNGTGRSHSFAGAKVSDTSSLVAGGMTGRQATQYFHRPSRD